MRLRTAPRIVGLIGALALAIQTTVMYGVGRRTGLSYTSDTDPGGQQHAMADQGSRTRKENVMDEDQQRPEAPLDTAIKAEPAADQAPTEPGPEQPEDRPREESGRYLRTAAVSAAVLLFALAFFTAGYWIGDRRSGDENGGAMTASASDDPAWGPEDAAVTIEEFGDFQCPYCGAFAQETLPRIREAYGDSVRYVFRDFPLASIHPDALKAAEAAQCAHEQGLFWEYHDYLFADPAALSVPGLKRYAEQVGANTGEFNECLDSGKNGWEVMLDIRAGRQAGVSGTPAFLINGILLPGAVSFEQFQAIIDQALAGAGG